VYHATPIRCAAEHIVVWLLYHAGRVLGQFIHELLYGLCALNYCVEFIRHVVGGMSGCAGIISAALAPLSPRSSHGPGD
jgi:hypothetical protein